ncbi:MAG TPA: terminase family protein [Novosphingobium sp.]|nr:terminase family protein [Novosphingobium sp.]
MPTIPAILHGTDPAVREAMLRTLPERQLRALARAFGEWAHGGQLAPPCTASGEDWRTWVLMAGRGFGKTRAGAEWVLGRVRDAKRKDSPSTCSGRAGLLKAPTDPLRIALVAATIDEARAVMVEGPSGILACAGPNDIADWLPSRHLLKFASGAEASLYSGASPNALRGPQHHFAWCDELAKWRHLLATWDMLQLGLRCGVQPRALVTTTPRGGCAALAGILTEPDTVVTGGPTSANPHLSPAFVAAATRRYGGTRMGREELDGVFLPEVAGSLWPAALLAASRGAMPDLDALRRVVVGVDPPASAAGTCGIVVCGLDADGVGHVLADRSAGGLSPEGWARAVAAAAEHWGADRVVAEKNQGGDMVRSVLNSVGIAAAITLVSATRSKVRRAEPIAGLFESGRARLAGRFPELEDELAGLVAGGDYQGPGHSPDRADAMVWALHALLIAPRGETRVVSFA